jgi:NAD(P)-dependent dehydrogenase (short-subunit alcohol dehydrogenase family)
MGMDLKLSGRIALFTGPAKGMGSAIAAAFAREGCDLALIGRDTDAIAPVAQAVRERGRRAVVLRCDVTDTARCQAVVEETVAVFGRIDVLVNVAGAPGRWARPGGKRVGMPACSSRPRCIARSPAPTCRSMVAGP